MRIFVTGDTHGNTDWFRSYLYPTAMALDADKMLVLGDFGFWEHTAEGVDFMNQVDCLGFDSGIPLYWLRGNHDNYALALRQYGANMDPGGFIACRENVRLIPDGHSWAWDGNTMRAFGGAYSIDKDVRLRMEKRKYDQKLREAEYRAAKKGVRIGSVPSQAGTLWFPEEEITDDQMYDLLAEDDEAKDIVFSHDKPMSSQPGWNRKDLALCLPNQLRMEAALRVHRPAYWLHGHLHYFYQDVQSDTGTVVIGLDPDRRAAETGWKHRQSWLLLDLEPGRIGMTLGLDADLDLEKVKVAKSKLL